MYTDSIADMLTRIRNASMADRPEVVLPHSKIKESLGNLLLKEGYVSGVEVLGSLKKLIKVVLKYDGSTSVITGIKRVSTPGQRIYVPFGKIPRTASGFGITVISTSQGLMTDRQARKAKVGGEIICQVW